MLGSKQAVYLLCLAASTGCAFLLIRSYLQSRAKLVLWTSLCFALLSVNNLLVVLDLMVFPSVELILYRKLASLAAVGVLLFGFIWEVD